MLLHNLHLLKRMIAMFPVNPRNPPQPPRYTVVKLWAISLFLDIKYTPFNDIDALSLTNWKSIFRNFLLKITELEKMKLFEWSSIWLEGFWIEFCMQKTHKISALKIIHSFRRGKGYWKIYSSVLNCWNKMRF